jgi:hypothetical protein
MNFYQKCIQTLDEIGGAYELDKGFSETSLELSGWTEAPTILEFYKKTEPRAKFKPLKIYSEENRLQKPLRNYAKDLKIPLLGCYHKKIITKTNSPIKKPENLTPDNRLLIKRCTNYLKSSDYQKPLQITTIPLLKNELHRRNKSLTYDKRHTSNLRKYYDQSFLIIKKSPPVVSGCSVTFYHK